MKHFRPHGLEAILEEFTMRAAAEDYASRAAACEALGRACEELGLDASEFDNEARDLRQRQHDITKHLRGKTNATFNTI
jgi:hypothetical protein